MSIERPEISSEKDKEKPKGNKYRGCEVYSAGRGTAKLYIPAQLISNLKFPKGGGVISACERLFKKAFEGRESRVTGMFGRPSNIMRNGISESPYEIVLPVDGNSQMLESFVDSLYDNQK
jgi:hypothetical protein